MNRITTLFGVDYPIIQAGMIWCSGWKLAAAVSNAGGLGIIGSGSMYPDVLEEHVQKYRAASSRPFAVNLPMLYPDIDKHIQTIIKYKVPIVFSSAGNPKTWTSMLKDNGITVVHVVSSARFAAKAEAAGVDAVVAEGFEAGGHNGREETTTLCLIPQVIKEVSLPVIAAGGIGNGKAMLAAMALGADAVQVGSRFVLSEESSAHLHFKERVRDAGEGETLLTLKELTPVRLIRNPFYEKVEQAYRTCATVDDLKQLLGRGRAKKGMFEGDMVDGELEIGQVSGYLDDILPAAAIVQNMLKEFRQARMELTEDNRYNF